MLNRLKDYINDNSFKINIYKNKINVVNYLDIITLEEDRISLKYQEGMIIIKGNNLSVNKLLDNEILITGEIKSVELEWFYVS